MGEQFARLRLGRINFLNVLPIYYAMEAGITANPFEIVAEDPARLNELCASGGLDMSPVSSIEYGRRADLYHVVPELSISSVGEVKSVLLLSRLPVEQLTGKKILTSSKSQTSVGLLKVLCKLRYGVEPRFETGSCLECFSETGRPDACLAIGDEALRLAASGLYGHVLDLGTAWLEWTGLPFVFAIWVLRRDVVAQNNSQLPHAIEALLSSKRWGLANLGKVCEVAAATGLMPVREFEEYYRCLKYDFNEPERRALELFYSCLFQAGELERVPPLDVYTPLASVA
ncbi:MAG: menaquinone biosynthesis protein [Syntrophobacteraceae bacterium]|nr:menaquinone biosynthesis protein [Syntrophobacteraceae bacterium]